MKKLQDEMKKANNPYVSLIGDYLLNHLKANPVDEVKLADNNKTIQGSLDAMRKAAEKKKVGNMAVLSDEEGFAVVCDYFNIKGNSAAPALVESKTCEADLVIDVRLGG
ncbi:hypothetical protein MST22_15580 [Virgibacillus halodenitrificans]|uniref:hypothetical protein n=1 Tax=Virgibacillus halodenitrificans TaxID=1482 RepID=UPI001FB55E7C|nr:hypothetical protein [Virgibacillus halodenitrificans]MCJ0932568.1 hypothetical protein [Virgibacillus halodenitrificans]